MSNLRTAQPFRSQPLASLIEDLMVTLYRQWVELPLLGTRKHIDTHRHHLAKLLRAQNPGKAQVRNALRAFVEDATLLPGVNQCASDELSALQKALAANGELAPTDWAQLADLLSASDPLQRALQSLVYPPNQLETTLAAVRRAVERGAAHSDAATWLTITTIFNQLDQQLATTMIYAERATLTEQALLKLEKLPVVRMLAWREFVAGKVKAAELAGQSSARGSAHAVTRGGAAWTKDVELVTAMSFPVALPEKSSIIDLDAAATNLKFFSDVRFPGILKRAEETPLIVRLTRQQAEQTVAVVGVNVIFADVGQPELVDVVISAPGFGERFNVWHRTIKVYADADSEPAVFLLKGEKLGKTQITVDFRHKERLIGSVSFACEVAERLTSGKASPTGEKLEISEFLATPPPPADLELRIVKVDKTLHFTLHSANPKVGYHWKKVGETTLHKADPGKWLAEKIEQLSRLARISRDFGRAPSGATKPAAIDPSEIIDGIGTNLWDELVPQELRNEYWGLIKKLRDDGTLKSLLITSDEPWIPWEMLKPYRVDEYSQEQEIDLFWAEGFAVCRWLSGRGPADEVKISAASIVAPVLDLANVKREVAGIHTQFANHGVQIGDPIKTVVEVKQVIKEATAQLLHFASHGGFEEENPEQSKIALQDGVLMPDDLSVTNTALLRQARPLVFLNTCNAGRLGFTPTDLGGWADRLVRTVRAFAVIGAQWEVNDALAADFAEIFYTELLNGKWLGEAFQIARLAIQKKDPLNPTWLAYTLYGDPNSRVVT